MRTNLTSALTAGAVALLLSAAPALAEVISFSASLSGAAAVPPNDATGTGTVTADYDTDTRLFTWTISYEGLTGPATAAHFHGPADPDANAPPVVPVDLAGSGDDAVPTSLTEPEPATTAEDSEATSQITGEATLTEEQAADLRAGRWYFNVHTAQYPDGELRGQLPAFAQ